MKFSFFRTFFSVYGKFIRYLHKKMHKNGLLYVLEKMVGNFKILFDNFSIFTRPIYTTIYICISVQLFTNCFSWFFVVRPFV